MEWHTKTFLIAANQLPFFLIFLALLFFLQQMLYEELDLLIFKLNANCMSGKVHTQFT